MVSQVDEGSELSGATEGHAEGDEMRLVPVGESIRYRRRAQSAERKVEELTGRLETLESEAADLAAQLEDARNERQIVRLLASEKVRDIETALLVVKSRLDGSEERDVKAAIDGLRKDKPYLFGEVDRESAAPQKTSGARDRSGSGRTALEGVARRAAETGSRRDLQEYLRKKRNVS